MGRAAAHHHGVRGSAALATSPLSPGAVQAEVLEPGEMRRVAFAGELLGAARVRSGFVAIPVDAFDQAAPRLAVEEQAAYLQLLRLSYGEGRNWCRVGKRDLQVRLQLSERRLLRVLDGLVARSLARPLQRDNRGTLWRIYLPREAVGAPVGDGVLLGRAEPTGGDPGRAPGARSRARSVAPRPASLAAAAGPGRPRSGAALIPPAVAPRADWLPLARALCEARGELGPEGLARAEREVAELVSEGEPLARIAAAVETARRRGVARAHAAAAPIRGVP
jgi:hypothetical protein